jgi:serine/threonine protein kinase
MLPRVGSELAGYRLESVIARGGMSTVFLAEGLRLSRKVAVKILATELSDDDMFRERFVRESRTAASLDHPNIISIYEAGEVQGLLFIAMRYVQGPNLKGLIEKAGPLPPRRLLPILGQVASALDSAHARGLVHRDVKPGNILIDPEVGPEHLDHVYLCDFGLTKQTTSHSGLTRTGQFVGTVDYIAPEQVEGRDVDARTDIYSLACVVYECLTGSVPFDRENEAAVLWAHVQESPVRVTERQPELPPSIDQVMATAMAKAPDDRYQTCAEFVGALRSSLAVTGTRPPEQEGETVFRRRDDAGESARPAPTAAAITPRAPAAPRPPDPDVIPAPPPTPEGSPSPSRRPKSGIQRPPGRPRPAALFATAVLALLVGLAGGWAIGSAASDGGVIEEGPGEIYRRILIAHIPADFVDTCHESDVPPPPPLSRGDVFATAECAPEGIEVQYRLVHTTDWMTRTFREILETASIEPSVAVAERLNRVVPGAEMIEGSDLDGLCEDDVAGAVANFWFQGPTDEAHEEGPHRVRAQDVGMAAEGEHDRPERARGLIACHRDVSTGRNTIVWTDNQTTILGVATSTQPLALYSWWRDESGPVLEAQHDDGTGPTGATDEDHEG